MKKQTEWIPVGSKTTTTRTSNRSRITITSGLVAGAYYSARPAAGLTEKEIKELCPDIKLPEKIDLSKGWYNKDHRETEEEFRKRVKEVINMFKEMAQNCKEENYTVCFIGHNDFLDGFFSMLNNSNFVVNNQLNISHDNLCFSSFDIDKNRKVTINYINFDPKI